MANSVPARWLPYHALGESIPGTRFISFKVPLKEEICNKLPPNERFTPCMLMEKVGCLGLVIDLTNTTRYYNPEELKRRGVQHVKILCEGHKVPNTAVVARFYAAVDDYLKKNPENGTLIGVHCTHGVNRTGYLVCRYMIDKLGFQPDAAIDAFNKARHHNIERPLYLEGLRLAAGDDAMPTAATGHSSQPREAEGFPSSSQPNFSRRSMFGPDEGRPYSPQRGAVPHYRQQRNNRGRGDYWRSGDRPPPRPPARAGWRAVTSYPQEQLDEFRNYPVSDYNFNNYWGPEGNYVTYLNRNTEFTSHPYSSHSHQSPYSGMQRYTGGSWEWQCNSSSRQRRT